MNPRTAGRFFFWNRIERKAVWTLEPALFGAEIGPPNDPPLIPIPPSKSRVEPSPLPLLPLLLSRSRVEENQEPNLLDKDLKPSPSLDGSADCVAEFPSSENKAKFADGLRVTGGLGQGGYGCVVQVVHEVTGGTFAMKSISKARLNSSRDRQRLALELKIMTETQPSSFLNTCHAAFETTNDIFFVLDLVSGGDLFYHLAKRFNATNSGFVEDEARVILAEIVCGLGHLHTSGFIHRDIKVRRCSNADIFSGLFFV